jgi:hypothetical protein
LFKVLIYLIFKVNQFREEEKIIITSKKEILLKRIFYIRIKKKSVNVKKTNMHSLHLNEDTKIIYEIDRLVIGLI